MPNFSIQTTHLQTTHRDPQIDEILRRHNTSQSLLHIIDLIKKNNLSEVIIHRKQEKNSNHPKTSNLSDLNKELLDVAKNGKTAQVRSLLTKAVDVDFTDANGQTALMLAARFGHRNIVKALLEAGANIYAEDRTGNTVASIVRTQIAASTQSFNHNYQDIIDLIDNQIEKDLKEQQIRFKHDRTLSPKVVKPIKRSQLSQKNLHSNNMFFRGRVGRATERPYSSNRIPQRTNRVAQHTQMRGRL